MKEDYSSRTIIVDFCHRFTVISMKDMPVPIGQIHSFHSFVKGVKKVRSAVKSEFSFGSVLSIFFIFSTVAVVSLYC